MPPPERTVGLYAHALEAGVRFPLHSFFSKVLTLFCLAPGQITRSGWRALVGFVVLCNDAGVEPSTIVFRYFFALVEHESRCWYGFRQKHDGRALFSRHSIMERRKYYSEAEQAWKGRFFFLTSPEPWACPVLWGEPPSKTKYKYSVTDPVLTSQQKKMVAKLLGAHSTAVDLRTYLSDTKLAAAFSSNLASPPPGLVLHSTGAKGIDSSPATVDISDAAALSWPAAYRVTSSLLAQDAVDALCTKHIVPTAYTARPAGDRRAFTPPPEGAVCLYAHALEAGVRFPLHSFFCEVLTHFNLAPGQLVYSGWRALVGFVVLCNDAGVEPSTTVFRYFFSLVPSISGWYDFIARHGCALFTGYYSEPNEAWKGRFFFLISPEPWPCPVRWGEPRIVRGPVLTSQQKKMVVKLLDAHGTAVDLQTYLSDTKLAAVFSSNLGSPPPGPALHSTGAKEMDATAAKVKPEPDGDEPTLSLKKRKHDEAAIAKDGICHSEQSTPHAANGCLASASGLSAPLGSHPKAQHSPVPSLPSPGVEACTHEYTRQRTRIGTSRLAPSWIDS